MNFKQMAVAAGIKTDCTDMGAASCVFTEGCKGVAQQEFEGVLYIAYAEGRKDEREALIDLLTWAYGKLHHRSFGGMEDALQLDRLKMMFTENLL